jgi:hypothetical protein
MNVTSSHRGVDPGFPERTATSASAAKRSATESRSVDRNQLVATISAASRERALASRREQIRSMLAASRREVFSSVTMRQKRHASGSASRHKRDALRRMPSIPAVATQRPHAGTSRYRTCSSLSVPPMNPSTMTDDTRRTSRSHASGAASDRARPIVSDARQKSRGIAETRASRTRTVASASPVKA